MSRETIGGSRGGTSPPLTPWMISRIRRPAANAALTPPHATTPSPRARCARDGHLVAANREARACGLITRCAALAAARPVHSARCIARSNRCECNCKGMTAEAVSGGGGGRGESRGGGRNAAALRKVYLKESPAARDVVRAALPLL